MSLNLEKQLTFVSPRLGLFYVAGHGRPGRLTCSPQYGAYHHNHVNVVIHMVCVPLILFSAFEIVRSPFPGAAASSVLTARRLPTTAPFSRCRHGFKYPIWSRTWAPSPPCYGAASTSSSSPWQGAPWR